MNEDLTTTSEDIPAETPSDVPVTEGERAPSLRRSETARRLPFANWVIPAAAVLGIILIAWLVWWLVVVMPVQRQVDTAAARYSEGDYVKAEAILKQVFDKDPNHRNALLELARVKGATGDSKAALELYQKVIDAGGGTAGVFYEMALLERVTGQSRKAAEHFQSASDRDRANLSYSDELAKTLVQIGKAAEAAEIYLLTADDTSRDKKQRKDYYILAGLAWTEAGKMKEAKGSFQDALKLVPNDPQAKMLLDRLK